MSYTYEYPRPMVTVDCIIFSSRPDKGFDVLLIQRKNDPFKNKWAFPGGFIEMDEELIDSAYRELEEETGIKKKDVKLIEFGVFGTPGRDPRGRTITISYYGFVDRAQQKIIPADDAKDAKWFAVEQLPQLAFDHNDMITFALSKIAR